MNMQRGVRIVVGFGAVLVLLMIAVAVFRPRQTVELRFSAADVQAQIDRRMPMRDGKDGGEITSVRATLGNGHLIDLEVAMRDDFLGRTASGSVRARCKISYAAGTFYLDSVDVYAVKIDAVELVKHDMRRLRAFKNHYVRPSQQSDAADDRLPDQTRLERWASESMTDVLRKHPIYTIPNDTWQGRIKRALIEDVQIESDAIIVVLSPWARVLSTAVR